MMKKENRFLLLLAVCWCAFTFFQSCKKDDDTDDGINEPITFLAPDTNWISAEPGSVIDLRIALTTDRVIDSITGSYHIDTSMSGFDRSSDPVIQFVKSGWAEDNNLQTFIGQYTMPADTFIDNGDVLHLVFVMEAQDLVYEKVMRIDVD